MSPSPLISIESLRKSYPGNTQPAVDDVSLTIDEGCFFGLLGPNGAGKTTLLSIIAGLLSADRGTVSIAGASATHKTSDSKKYLGLVPQELAVYPTLTARENLAFFGAMQGLRGARLQQRIDACLALGKLNDWADKKVETFSGGLKRRLNLVIGLIHEPRVLILDEPTVGIDPQSRNLIFESLRQLNRDGMTLIYTTHYMEEVEQLCDTIAIMDQGRIIAEGSLHSLLNAASSNTIRLRTRQTAHESIADHLARSTAVESVVVSEQRLDIVATDPMTRYASILDVLGEQGISVLSVSIGNKNLEELFLNLTGTTLRD